MNTFSMRKKVAIVLVAAVLSYLFLLPIDMIYADAATTSNAMLVTVDAEPGTFTNAVDAQGNYMAQIKTNTGRVVRLTSYVTGDWDYNDGWDMYAYRTVNGITTITSRVNGVEKVQYGRIVGNDIGKIEVVNGAGTLIERHYISGEYWKLEEFNNGKLMKVSSVELVTPDYKTGTVTVRIEADPSVVPTTPTATPTSTPTATTAPTTPPVVMPTLPPYNPSNPTTAPTATPSATPSATPTTAPSATPSTSPSASPEVSPSASPSTEPTVAPEPVSNFSSLKHSTKIEKKAYSSLKSLNSLANKHGWDVKRRYTRKSSSKKKVKTSVYLRGYKNADYDQTFSFTHVIVKSGKKYQVKYYQNGKQVSASGVKKLIKSLG